MSKNVLVLNTQVSGINDYLFSELKRKNWNLLICDIPFPYRLRCWAIIISFSFKRNEWKTKFNRNLDKLYKSSWCFQWRSKYSENLLQKLKGQYDIVFQLSSMFQASLNKKPEVPYAILVDYTTASALKWEPWAPYKKEIDKWIFLERQLYESVDIIFAPSENTIRSLTEDYTISSEKIFKTGYGINLAKIEDLTKNYDGKTILFVGIDFKRKGGFILLEAFKEVLKEVEDARLVVIGPSNSKYKIEQKGVNNLGLVSDRNVISENFKKASVFVMPSLCEPFGLVFLEAMAYKLPCIGSKIDAIPEIIDHEKTGYIVEPDNAKDLSQKIISLLQNQQKMQAMGIAGFNKVKDAFKWDKISDDIDRNFEFLLSEK